MAANVEAGSITTLRASRVARSSTGSPAREAARKHFVGVVMLIYLLLIFEGSLRKWLLPQWSFYIFFIRDPFLLYAYFVATRHGLWPKRSGFLIFCVLASALGLLLACIQLGSQEVDELRVTLAIYGWRNYFLYMPLACLIGAQFRAKDVARLCLWTLLLSVPMGLLVFAQFSAPVNSAINVGTASDTALQFQGLVQTGDHVRPMGTFSSLAGQIQFVASSFAILLAMLMTPARIRLVPRWLLLYAVAGIATCVAFSGSRSIVLHCGLIATMALGLAVFGRGAAVRARALLLPLLVAGTFAALYPIVFPSGFEAFATRWAQAAGGEAKIFESGVLGRAFYAVYDFGRLFDQAPLLGWGLGLGTNASTILGIKIEGVMPLMLAETDWSRHILELGPIFGTLYIALRIALVVWLGVLVLKALRRGAGALPLVLFAYAGYVLLLGQITGQGANNAYVWLFTGFCIAVATQPARARRPMNDRIRVLERRSRASNTSR